MISVAARTFIAGDLLFLQSPVHYYRRILSGEKLDRYLVTTDRSVLDRFRKENLITLYSGDYHQHRFELRSLVASFENHIEKRGVKATSSSFFPPFSLFSL